MEFVRTNFWLIILALTSGAMLIWQSFGRGLLGLKEVGVLEATQLINHRDALVLDVREDKEFSGGHIPNAKHIPLGQLHARTRELEKYRSRPIVVSCRSGSRSARACGLLGKEGFGEVYNLKGGMLVWEQANMPLEK